MRSIDLAQLIRAVVANQGLPPLDETETVWLFKRRVSNLELGFAEREYRGRTSVSLDQARIAVRGWLAERTLNELSIKLDMLLAEEE